MHWLQKTKEPLLEISYEHKHPFCRATKIHIVGGDPKRKWDCYYFRFKVTNKKEREQVRQCEAVLKKFWIYDSANKPILQENFSPVNMNWVDRPPGQLYIDISSEREFYCDIGHIATIDFQLECERDKYNLPINEGAKLRFMFDLHTYFSSQLNYLDPGKRCILQVEVYSANAPTETAFFEISWSGNWKNNEADMFSEIVISLTKEPKQST